MLNLPLQSSKMKREESRTSWRLFKQSLRKLFLKNGKIIRTQEIDTEGYDEDWNYLPSSMKTDVSPGTSYIHDTLVLWRSIDRRKHVLGRVSELLAGIHPESFAELGSGNGINILSLVVLCPWIHRWRGVEISATGVKTAKDFLQNPHYESLIFITGQSKETIQERLKNADVDFIQADMTQIPVANGEFDCVFSQQAIERLPSNYMNAFREARRVAKKNAIFIESFIEVQRTFVQRLYLYASDYFRASFRDVEKVGFKVLLFEPIIAKAKHASGLLLCKSH